jgi:hypothetical protein
MTEQVGAFDDSLDDLFDVKPVRRQPVPLVTIFVHFASPEDRRQFERDIGHRIPITDEMWYPRPPEVEP